MQTRNALDIALQLTGNRRWRTRCAAMACHPGCWRIEIAAGSEEEIETPAEHTPEETQEIREAAIFFLQNCLFQAGDDSYRVLGVRPDAAVGEIRLHKRWLLKWLHPDVNRNKWEAVYLQRVLTAWNEIAVSASTAGTLPPPEGLIRRRASAPGDIAVTGL